MRDKIISFKANPESVDVENRVIRNAILAKAGEAKGHGFSIEQKFIDKLVEQCATEGLLSNFGHNWDNMGLQLGRAKDIRCEGDTAMGDLYIYANADNSPRFKGMGTWVLNQAKEDPSSIMLSIRFRLSHFYQYNAQNQEIPLQTNRWGEPIKVFKDATIFAALDTVKSVDVVDEGALTETMFSENKDEQGFFSRLINFITGKSMTNQTSPDDGGTNDGAIIWVGEKQFKAADVTAMLTEITALKAENDEKRTNSELLTAKLAAADEKLVMLESEKNGLVAENLALKAVPAGVLTNGATGSNAKTADPEFAAFGAALRRK